MKADGDRLGRTTPPDVTQETLRTDKAERDKKVGRSQQLTEEEIGEAERPIVADLHSAGFDVKSALGLLAADSTSWSRALPVLARHVEQGDYPNLLMYRLTRLFGRPEGLPFWEMLAQRFSTRAGSTEQEGIAYALGTMATADHLDDLVGLLRLDGANGRWEFVEPIARLGGDEGVEAVMPYSAEFPYYVDRALSRRKAAATRPRRYARAQKKLAQAIASRVEPVLDADAVEWSTSFDMPNWKRFAIHLRAELGGELDDPLGKALFATILSAPEDNEQHVLVNTHHGVVRVGWFIDDTDVVDFYIFGPQEVYDLCDAIIDKYFPEM